MVPYNKDYWSSLVPYNMTTGTYNKDYWYIYLGLLVLYLGLLVLWTRSYGTMEHGVP